MNTADHIPAERLTGAIARMFIERGDACLREFTLRSGRRVDLIAIGSGGEITIVEVKSSRQDFISDRKWQEYPEWADRFYFAVAEGFPRDLLPGPDESGIIITDGFDCLEVQPAPLAKPSAMRTTQSLNKPATSIFTFPTAKSHVGSVASFLTTTPKAALKKLSLL